VRRRHHGAQRRLDRTSWIGQEVGDARERLVWLGIEDMQDRADEEAVALAIPSFFEIKESDGGESFPKRIGSYFFEARADCKLERGERTRESPIQIK